MDLAQVLYYLELPLVRQINLLSGKDTEMGLNI